MLKIRKSKRKQFRLNYLVGNRAFLGVVVRACAYEFMYDNDGEFHRIHACAQCPIFTRTGSDLPACAPVASFTVIGNGGMEKCHEQGLAVIAELNPKGDAARRCR